MPSVGMADPAASPTKAKSFTSLFEAPAMHRGESATNLTLIPSAMHRGEPALMIPKELID